MGKRQVKTERDAKRQTIWLCRHGNRMDFVDPSWKGTDPPLSPDGVRQARETGERLRGEGIRHIVASPFLRTVETAHHIAEILDLPVRVEPGASEWMNVAWFSEPPALQSPDVLAGRFPRLDSRYAPQVEPRHPETPEAMLARCAETTRLLLEAFSEDILIVGHGASVAGITQALLGAKPPLSCCGLCALTKVVRTPAGAELVLSGDESHLTNGGGARGRFV